MQFLNCSRESAELPLLLQVAGERCSLLRKLDLSWCPKIPLTPFCQAFPTFRKLKSLDLSHSNAGDDHLAVVGVYGRALEEINLAFTKVGDHGVVSLVKEVDHDARADGRYGQCRKLRLLDVQSTFVTDEGAATMLRCRPDSLTRLEFGNSLRAVFALLEEDPGLEFDLMSLHSCESYLGGVAFAAAVRACPHLRSLHLASLPQDDAHLACLVDGSLSGGLEELHLANHVEEETVDASRLELPLRCHGESLRDLSLAEAAGVDVQMILLACPGLQHLSLQFNRSFSHVNRPYSAKAPAEPTRLRSVKVLCVSQETGVENDNEVLAQRSPSGQDLDRLLNSPMLETLSLSRCVNLTDEIVSSSTSSMERLVAISLDHCDSVTLDSLDELLTGHNSLSDVKLTQCRDITRKDADRYEKKLKKMKMAKFVKVKWL